jgi:3-phenylpropionate/trans-cinnamate dioxygenase ferredoxin component
MTNYDAGDVSELPPGKVIGVGPWAVGNNGGELFAVSRRCRHLRADLAGGTVDDDGCLVCPWHQAKYDVTTGRMVRGPQGVFAKVPGLGPMFMALTKVLPLGRAQVVEREGRVIVE